MNDLHKAIGLALSALNSCDFDFDSEENEYKTFDEDLVEKASCALRQALAQPEQTRRVCNTCDGTGMAKGLHNWKGGGKRDQPCWACHEVADEKKEPALGDADPRLLLGRSNNFTKEIENRLCDIERRLAAADTQPALAQPEQEPINKMPTKIFGPNLEQILNASGFYRLPEQKPKAWLYNGHLHECDPSDWAESEVKPLYTAPPSKPWLSLTDEEIESIVDLNTTDDAGFDIFCDGHGIARAVETKLKEKNT